VRTMSFCTYGGTLPISPHAYTAKNLLTPLAGNMKPTLWSLLRKLGLHASPTV